MKISPPPHAGGMLTAIGDTPLIPFARYLDVPDIDLLAKWEAANPGGSAKDRPAAAMINEGLQRRWIDRETTIVESSSGNLGVALAHVCRFHGLSFVCVADPRIQTQNLQIIEALGGRVEMVRRPIQGDWLKARLHRVGQLLDQIPGSYWPNQYANLANVNSHYQGTIREIDEALSGRFDYLFVATSSTGTARGCRDYLRSERRDTKVVAVDAVGSVLFGGKNGPRLIPGIGAGQVPPLASEQRFDLIQRVTDLDCVVGCRRAARREALLVGGSSGGVLQVIHRMRDQLRGQRCVAILHDSGTRYLNTIFDDGWVAEHLGCDSHRLETLLRNEQGATA